MEDILKNLNKQQMDAVKTINGPVLIIAGPGSGKCILGDTLVFTNKGILRVDQIPEFYKLNNNEACKAGVISYDLKGAQFNKNSSHWFRLKTDKTIKVTSRSGYQLEGTPEHPILILNKSGGLEFRKLKDLNGDEIIAISKNNNIWGNFKLKPNLAYLMGLLVGDGCLGYKGGIGFAQVDPLLTKIFKLLIAKFFSYPVSKIKSYNRYAEDDKRKSTSHYVFSTEVKRKLQDLGLDAVGSLKKSIPQSVLMAPKESIKAFIQGLFDTDGSVSGATAELTTASEVLARQLQICLLNFGIRTSLKPRYVKAYKNRSYWRISIMGTSLRVFAKEIGFRHQPKKQLILNLITQKINNSNVEIIPYQHLNIAYVKNRYLLGSGVYDSHNYYIYPTDKKRIEIKRYLKSIRNPSPKQLLRIIEIADPNLKDFKNKNLYNLCSNFFFDPIISVEKLNKETTVYDFTIPDTHSFVANGFINHNTKALTHRIAYMIESGIKPENILAITFTNKASQEMKERTNKLLGIKNKYQRQPTLGTFHSICAKILRNEAKTLGFSKNFTIYDEDDQLSLIKKVMEELGFSQKNFNPYSILNRISKLKSILSYPDKYQKEAQNYYENTVSQIYTAYQKELQKANAMDFDDLIMLTVRLFQEKNQILEKYQNQFKYILVDEYQDTNVSQYALTKLLSAKHKNIFAIGDTDQSIYTWRHADFRNMLNFEKDFPEAKIIRLEQNYRSTKTILAAGQGLIQKNIYRHQKDLWTENSEGEKISVAQLEDEKEEASFIIEKMKELIKKGYKLNDFVILYRTHAQSRPIEEEFLNQGFPYKIVGALKFYERKEIKDILAYLRILSNPNDFIGLQRIYNVPSRGIGKTTFLQLANYARKNNLNLFESLIKSKEIEELPAKSRFALYSFGKIIEKINQRIENMSVGNLTKLMKSIIDEIGYKEYLDTKTEEGYMRWENVKELLTVAKKYDKLEIKEALNKFLEEVALIQETENIDEEKNVIYMMTLHSAKGLEFPVVFLVGAEEGLLPHSKSLNNPIELEEERRLCYVGITRAKRRVFITLARSRTIFGTSSQGISSRFLGELPKEAVETSLNLESPNEKIINYTG